MINTKFHGDRSREDATRVESPGTSPELSGSKAMGSVLFWYIALNVLDILDRFS